MIDFSNETVLLILNNFKDRTPHQSIWKYSYNAINEFYQKRIIQIYSYLKENLQNSNVFFMYKDEV